MDAIRSLARRRRGKREPTAPPGFAGPLLGEILCWQPESGYTPPAVQVGRASGSAYGALTARALEPGAPRPASEPVPEAERQPADALDRDGNPRSIVLTFRAVLAADRARAVPDHRRHRPAAPVRRSRSAAVARVLTRDTAMVS